MPLSWRIEKQKGLLMEKEPNNLVRALHVRRRDVNDADIAQALGSDLTAVSRVFSDQYGIKLSRLDAFLRVMGFRVIPSTERIREVPEEHYQSIVVMADIGAEALRRGDIHQKFHRRCVLKPGPGEGK